MSHDTKHPKLIQLTHWLSAILILGLFILGIWMVELSYYDPWYQRAPNIHKGLGVLLAIIMLARLLVKVVQTSPKPLENIAAWQNKLAGLTHILMYLCTFIILISGYLISTASGKAINVFDMFSVPAVLSYGNEQADTAGLIHQYTAYVLIGLVVLHILAFIQHQFILKDEIIKRITPIK